MMRWSSFEKFINLLITLSHLYKTIILHMDQCRTGVNTQTSIISDKSVVGTNSTI